jgi:CHAT domain-containing protein/tetratricopeptide (TPR) repeat protein
MRSADLASCLSEMSRFEEARKRFEASLPVVERELGKTHPHYASLLNGLGKVADSTSDLEKALTLYQEALAINRLALGEQATECGYNLSNLGVVYRTLGNYPRAETALQDAVVIFRLTLGPKHPDYAITLSNLGNLYTDRGEYDRAEVAHREALEVLMGWGGNGHPAAAMALNNLSTVYYYAGDYGRAAVMLHQSLAINRRVRGVGHESVGVTLQNLALVYSDAGLNDQAIATYEEALRILKSAVGEEHPNYLNTLHELGASYLRTDPKKADDILGRSAATRKKVLGPRHPDVASDLRMLGSAAARLGDYKRAESLLQEAIELRTSQLGADHPGLIGDLRTLAEVYATTGREKEALGLYKRCLVAQERSLGQVLGFVTESGMELKLAFIREILSELITLAMRRPDDSEARELALTWVLRLKAGALDTMCRYRDLQRAVSESPQVATQLARVRQTFDAYMKRLGQPVGPNEEAFQLQITTLRFEYDREQADLHRILDKHRPAAPVAGTTVAAVRSRLPAGVALVEMIRIIPYDFEARDPRVVWKEPRYVAFVLTTDPTVAPALIDLGDATTLGRSVQEFRETLARTPRELRLTDEKTLDAEFRELASRLELRVFAPIRRALGNAKTVLLAPDGVLNLLPFDALAVNDRYLIESFRFRYVTTGRDLLRAKGPQATGTTVFAGPDFDWRPEIAPEPSASGPVDRLVLRGIDVSELRGLRWRPLPGAGREAEDIRNALSGTEYGPIRTVTGAEARKTEFATVRSPRILHVATHGYFIPSRADESTELLAGRAGAQSVRPGLPPLLRSGLVFTGANQLTDRTAPAATAEAGWLTAEEVAQMNLRGTELVVLSACESGLGDVDQAGEGVYGLRRAFLYAGAGSLIVSLFKVPDVETRELMQEFYGRLGKGAKPADALHDAKRALIARRREIHGGAHPFFWASFIGIGGPP